MSKIGEVCERDVVVGTPDLTVAAAAKLMRHKHVGCVVIVDSMTGGLGVPRGIVTDRDIVVEVTATDLDPNTITVGDIMPREIVTEISFPIPEKSAYQKFPNPASRYALVGVAVAETAGGVRVAVTGAGSDGVFRVPAMEAALAKSFAASALAGIAVDPKTLSGDMHAAADYRAHLINVMAQRAVAMAG